MSILSAYDTPSSTSTVSALNQNHQGVSQQIDVSVLSYLDDQAI